MFKKFYFVIVLLFGCQLSAEDTYRFSGEHFFASYIDCNQEALCDLEGLRAAMRQAVDTCGATLLDACEYVFPPSGLTMVLLLSESHASIHTYPEYGACFVDLFTCGTHCSAEKFHEALRSYLKPVTVSSKTFLRGYDVEEAVN